jgi:exosortase
VAFQQFGQAIRSRPWRLSLGAVLLAIAFAFFGGLLDVLDTWTKADYSHGFLMPPFVGYLLWKRREKIPGEIAWPARGGLAFFVVAVALYFFASLNYAKEFVRGVAILAALAGVVWMFFGGRKGLKWAAPGLLFMLLALPLPNNVEEELSGRLRTIAANAGVFVLQTLGFPTYSIGYEISIGATKLQVAEACSGLSMLVTFIALTAGIVLLCPPTRRLSDRIFILLTSVPIAVVCNIGRIVVTGLIYHAGWKELGDQFVHDFAGWLMMPFALGMIWLEFKVIDWLLVTKEYATTEEYAKVAMANTAAKMKREDAERVASQAAWKSLVTGSPPPGPEPRP